MNFVKVRCILSRAVPVVEDSSCAKQVQMSQSSSLKSNGVSLQQNQSLSQSPVGVNLFVCCCNDCLFISRRDNKLFLFGENMPRFVDLIKANEKRFKDMPIGPVGAHIELAKGQFSGSSVVVCVAT